nr:hypothetical protein [Tanacetum cinerariifolium]
MSNDNNAKDEMRSDTNSPINKEHGLKIGGEFLKILRDNAFNGTNGGESNEIEGTTIGWNEIRNNFSRIYYFISHGKVPDDLDSGTDYLVFLYWLALKFDNYWETDKNTQNGLWKFYVNERTKGTLDDLDEEPRNESYKKTCLDTFYKPYLNAQEAKDIYELIDGEYSSIPIPARRDINNPDELCRTEEFTVVRHLIGTREEFVT